MSVAIHSEQGSALTNHRFSLLFVFLLAVLILYPYAESNHFGFYAFRVIGSFALLISVLSIPALVQRIALPKADASAFSTVNIVLSFLFDVVIVVVIFRRVFARDRPDSETIFGALCIYLLVGFSFASAYGLIAAFQPQAFYLDPRTNLHAIPDRFDFIYYSFGTMTSLGAAGITPVSGPARSVSVLEAILGVLYLAVLIARLMGAYRGTPVPDRN